jgi:hypothetical protein
MSWRWLTAPFHSMKQRPVELPFLLLKPFSKECNSGQHSICKGLANMPCSSVVPDLEHLTRKTLHHISRLTVGLTLLLVSVSLVTVMPSFSLKFVYHRTDDFGSDDFQGAHALPDGPLAAVLGV